MLNLDTFSGQGSPCKLYIYIYIYIGFTSNHRFIATELFRMVQGPHSSGNFDDNRVNIYIY